jgi:hypothetical protein
MLNEKEFQSLRKVLSAEDGTLLEDANDVMEEAGIEFEATKLNFRQVLKQLEKKYRSKLFPQAAEVKPEEPVTDGA